MARVTSEMMLIVRAQNQASGALRRVGTDLRALGRHRNMQIQQQKLLLNQQNLMRQRQRALNELQTIASGSRALNAQRRALQLSKAQGVLDRKRTGYLRDWHNISRQVAGAQERINKISNDQFRRETQRMRLLGRQAAAVRAEEAAIRNRRAMLKSRGGLKGVPDDVNVASKATIENARTRLTLLDRMLTANTMRQRELEASSRLTSRAITAQSRASGELGKKYAALSGESAILKNRNDAINASQRELAQRANIVRSQLSGIAQRYSIVTAQQKELGKAIRMQRWEPLATAGRTIQHLGRVGQYATLILGGGLGYAAHQAAMFQKEAQLVGTQMGEIGITAKQSAKLGTQLGDVLIKILPKGTSSVSELNEAAYDLFSSLDSAGKEFLTLADGTKLLALSSKAAIAGQTDIATATDGLIGVIQNFQVPVKDTSKILNRMFAAVRFGRMTFGEFSKTLSVTAPAANQAGQSFDTLAGTMAFLTRRLDVNKASIGFARLLEIFTREKFVTGFKKAGVAVTGANGKFLQLDEIMRNIVKRFPEVTQKGTKELAGFFKTIGNQEGTIQARRAFQALAVDMEEYQSVLGRVKRDNGEFNKSLQAMEATTGVRWEKFLNQLKAIALMIGSAVLPEILKLAPHITKAVNWFNDLDPAVRDNVVRIAALSVAVLGLASAIAFLLGPLIRFGAFLAQRRAFLLTFGAGFIAVGAAIAILTGKWDGLNTVMDSFFSLTDQGAWGWIAMFGIAAVAATKLTRAITAVRNAYIASAAVTTAGTAAGSLGGLAGMFGRGRRAASDVKGAGRIVAETSRNAGKLRAGLAAAGLAAMAIPGPLWIAGAAIGAAAGAAFLWKRHMDGVAKRAEQVRQGRMGFIAQVSRPQTQAADLAQLGPRMLEAKQLGIEYKRQQLTLKQLRAEFKGATGDQKKMLGLDIQDAVIRTAQYYRMWRDAQASVTQTSGQLANVINNQAVLMENARRKREQLLQAEKKLAELQRQRGKEPTKVFAESEAIKDLQNKIVGLKGALNEIDNRAVRTGQILRTSFGKVVKDLQNAAMLPARVPQGAIDAAMRVALARGRMLKPQEIKAVVRAYADKKSADKAAWDIQQAVKSIKATIVVERKAAKVKDLGNQMQKALHSGDATVVSEVRAKLTGAKEALKEARAKHREIDRAFSQTVVQQVDVKVNPPDTTPLGTAIGAGLERGMYGKVQDVRAAAVALAQAAIVPARGTLEARSPSRVFVRIGQDVVRGFIGGIIKEQNKLERVAALSMQLFEGAFMQKRNEALDSNEKFDQLKYEKLQQQALDSRARFAKKHKRIDEIRAREYEKRAREMRQFAKPISIDDLISDTNKQAALFRTFNKSMAELSRNKKVPRAMLDSLAELGSEGTKYIKMLADASPKDLQRFVRAWLRAQKEIRKSQRATVQGTKEYNAAMREQLKGLADEAADNLLGKWNEFHDQAKSNFGELFSGLEDKIGEGFESAHQSWADQVDDYKNQLKDLNQQVIDLNQEAADRLTDAIRERTEQLQQAMGQLFSGEWMQGPEMASKQEWGVAANFDDLFKDLQSQVDRFSRWRNTLTSLAAKVPPDLAKQLEALGPEALEQLEVLNGATSGQLSNYVTLWQQGQNTIAAIANQTTVDTSDIVSRMADVVEQIGKTTDALGKLAEPTPLTGQDILDGINNQIGAFQDYEATLQMLRDRGLPADLIQQLAAMGPQALPYLKALSTMTEGQLNEFVGKWHTAGRMIINATNAMMNDQLGIWYSHGANMAAAIIAGVASQQQPLVNYFKNLFMNLLQGKMPEMPVISTPIGGPPTPDFGGAGPGGENVDYFPVEPMYKGNAPAGRSFAGTSGTGGGDTNITLGPIYANPQEDLESQLNRASFRIRNDFD